MVGAGSLGKGFHENSKMDSVLNAAATENNYMVIYGDIAKAFYIATVSGSGTVTTGGSLIGPTYETLIDLQYAVNDEYRASNAAAWLFKDSTTAVIRKVRDGGGGTEGAPLWSPSMIAGGPDMLLGSPVYIDHNVAAMGSNAKIGFFADWNSFYVRQVGDVVVEVDRSRWFDTDQLGVRGKWRVDGNLADTDALVSMTQNV